MPRPHRYWVYILASRRNGTLYTGVTNDISRRSWEHREGNVQGFTTKYGVTILVWCEEYRYIDRAIQREKNIKHWSRAWKVNLIEQINPEWNDLYEVMIR